MKKKGFNYFFFFVIINSSEFLFVINIKGVIILSKAIEGYKNGFLLNDVIFVDYSVYVKDDLRKMFFLTFMEKGTFRQCKILYFPSDEDEFDYNVFDFIKTCEVDVLLNASVRGFTVKDILRREDSLSVLAG